MNRPKFNASGSNSRTPITFDIDGMDGRIAYATTQVQTNLPKPITSSTFYPNIGVEFEHVNCPSPRICTITARIKANSEQSANGIDEIFEQYLLDATPYLYDDGQGRGTYYARLADVQKGQRMKVVADDPDSEHFLTEYVLTIKVLYPYAGNINNL